MIYFTSDTHYWHKNVLNFEDRPYQSVEEMTEDMIQTWNDQVEDSDTVYHLGDLSLGTLEQAVDVLRRLKGKVVLIKGNHDYSKHYKKIASMNLLHDYHEVGMTMKYQKHQMWLTHYPMEIGVRPRKWSIHGHLHSEANNSLDQINVGVDSSDFKYSTFGRLVTIDELYDEMMKRLPLIEDIYSKRRKCSEGVG